MKKKKERRDAIQDLCSGAPQSGDTALLAGWRLYSCLCVGVCITVNATDSGVLEVRGDSLCSSGESGFGY